MHLRIEVNAIASMISLFVLLIGLAVIVGHEAFWWLAIGISAITMTGMEMTVAEDRSLMQLLSGRKSRYGSLIFRAKVYAESEFLRNHELHKEHVAIISSDLPKVEAHLRRFRDLLGLPQRDIA